MYLKSLLKLPFNFVRSDKKIVSLECELKAFFSVKEAIFVNQARVGLFLLASALFDLKRKKVLCSAYTIHDAVNMLVAAGWDPVFCDIDPVTFNMKMDDLKAKILSRDDIGAVVITHLHGVLCDFSEIEKICKEKNIAILEDAAQAVGAFDHRGYAGATGYAGVLSFGLMKNISSFYGGAILTNDLNLAKKLRKTQSRWKKISKIMFLKRMAQGLILSLATSPIIFQFITFRIFATGLKNDVGSINRLSQSETNPKLMRTFPESYKIRPSNLQASLVLEQLKTLESNMKLRRATANHYYENLNDLSDFNCLSPEEHSGSCFMQYPIKVAQRKDFLVFLNESGFDCAGQHLRNCAGLPCFSDWQTHCPNSALAETTTVLLPTYPRYEKMEAGRLVQKARSYLENKV